MKEKSKWADVLGIAFVILVVGAVICGILGCFSKTMLTIGIICGVIVALPLPLFLLWAVCCKIISLISPELSDENVEKWGWITVAFLMIGFLLYILFK